MSLSTLKPNSLYITLHARGSTATSGFHWGLYMHYNANSGGHKYHIKNIGTYWIADFEVTHGVFKSFLLIGLIRIATVHPSQLSQVHSIMNSVPPGAGTCRVWVLEVIRRLISSGIVYCNNIAGLEQEANNFAAYHLASCMANRQPRAVADSRCCQLA